MKHYSNSASWRRYKGLLKSVANIDLKEPSREYYSTVLGHRIHLDEWLPTGEPAGTLILVHGGGGNGRVLAPFAQLMCDMGWRVLAPDLPGYGLTKVKPDYNGDYNEWPRVIAAIADNESGKKALMGMSVGGLTAVYAAQEATGIQGVLATTLLDVNDNTFFVHAARWQWLGRLSLLGFKLMAPMIDRIKLPLRLAAPLGKMSDIDEVAQYFKTDELIGKRWVPVRFFRTMHQKPFNPNLPDFKVWLVHPGADNWTPTSMSVATYQKIDGNKHFIELTNGSHLPIEQPAFDELKKAMAQFLEVL